RWKTGRRCWETLRQPELYSTASCITPTSSVSRAGVGEFTIDNDTALPTIPTDLHSRSRNLPTRPCPSVAAFDLFAGGRLWVFGDTHAALNAVIISTFGAFTSGPLAGLWTGESGMLTLLVTVAVVALLVRGTWMMRKAPGDLPFAETRATAI